MILVLNILFTHSEGTRKMLYNPLKKNLKIRHIYRSRILNKHANGAKTSFFHCEAGESTESVLDKTEFACL